MTAFRILHVDDEPDIREIVDLSLGLNPDFEVRGCASGAEALVAAADWSPFIILLDVSMPVMDGPTTLAQLRTNPQTSEIPVLFMTARAQPREIEHFISLGAQGVISKPFDPMTLAEVLRGHLQAVRLRVLRAAFLRRAQAAAAALAPCRSSIVREKDPVEFGRIREIAHGLAGTAGLFGFDQISRDAAALEDAIIARLDGSGSRKNIKHALDRLIAHMEHDREAQPAVVA